jgi:hypothetical protein
MAILATLLNPHHTIVRYASKAGPWAVLAVVLVFFLMQQVLAGKHETQTMRAQHQTDSKDALRNQLEILRIICANLATNEAQRSYCFVVGNDTRLVGAEN